MSDPRTASTSRVISGFHRRAGGTLRSVVAADRDNHGRVLQKQVDHFHNCRSSIKIELVQQQIEQAESGNGMEETTADVLPLALRGSAVLTV